MELDSVRPFHLLAAAIRNKPQREAAEVLKAVSEVATEIYEINRGPMVFIHPNMQALLTKMDAWSTRRTLHRTESNHSVAHTLAELPPDRIFYFLERNVMRILGNPRTIIVKSQKITTAEMWLIACVIHKNADIDGSVRRLILPYIQEQPKYEPSISASQYINRLRDMAARAPADEMPAVGIPIPGLEYALNHFGIVQDMRSIYCLMLVYFRLGVTAAMLRGHLAVAHAISSQEAVTIDNVHLQGIVEGIDDAFALYLCRWHHRDPLRTRQELAHLNAGGIFLYFFNYVFPQVLCRDEPMPASHMAWEVCKYIAFEAAKFFATNSDRSFYRQNMWRLLDFFNSMDLGHIEHPIHDYNMVSPYLEFEYETFTDDEGDVEVEPYGERIQVYDYAVREGHPPNGSICTICQEYFSPEPHSDRAMASCVKLDCTHLFHFECIEAWLNASHSSEVACPNCRRSICVARPRRAARRTRARRTRWH